MMDLELVKQTYADLPIEKLILLARNEARLLTPEAFELLRKEMIKRGLNLENYLAIEEDPETSFVELQDLQVNKSGADDAMLGKSYVDLMYPIEPEKEKKLMEDDQAVLRKLSSSQVEREISKASFAMFLYFLLFLLGIIISVWSTITTGEDGRFFVATGVIVFGGFGFFRWFFKKQKLKSH